MTTDQQEIPIQAEQPEAQNIKKRAVCFSLKLSRFGGCKKVSSEQVQVDADKDWIRVSKHLIECPELDAIKKIDAEIRAFLYQRCLPSPFKAGIYLLPIKLFERVNGKMAEFQSTRAELVQAFVDAYAQAIERARERLEVLFDALDYPSQSEISGLFAMDVKIFEFSAPTALRAVNAELYERELERIKKTWEFAEAQVSQVLLQEMSGMVDHLVDKLKPDETGKKKIFRNSMVEKFQEWLTMVNDRNIAEDGRVTDLVNRARDLIGGIAPSELRNKKSEAMRNDIASGFEQIQSELALSIIEAPRRAIDLEDV